MKPRVRSDKVARRLVEDLQAALCHDVPAGTTVVFTCTAPIHLASKTTAALENEIRALLASRSNELAKTINGNRICVRIVRASHTPNVIGFVHNPDPGAAAALLAQAGEELREIKR
jgi:hypothetical protein